MVVFLQTEIMVACPECKQIGTHKGTCNWSMMRSGKVWTFVAKASETKWIEG